MKKIIILVLYILTNMQIFAQSSANISMGLTVWLPDNFEYSENTKNILKNKLKHLISSQGFTPDESRFVITAKIDVLNKYAEASFKPRYIYDLGLTLYIGDGVEGRAFASYYTELSGIGHRDHVALRNAINKLNVRDPKLSDFIIVSKDRISTYYEENCDAIISEAEMFYKLDRKDDALRSLISIPKSSTSCWKKSSYLATNLYQDKINVECKQKLSEARGIYAANQNSVGATRAMNVLMEISPNATCFNEASAFQNQIRNDISIQQAREWDLKVKKEYDIPMELIKAYRDIEVQRHTKVSDRNVYVYKSLY